MARIGVGSRRICEELIVDGRVTVNGVVPVLGRRVDPAVDRVELDGVPLPVQPGLVHYLVNKPAGVVSTAEDTHGRPTVVGPRAGGSPGVPGGAPRPRLRGPVDPHQRRRAHPSADPPVFRRAQGVPRPGGRGADLAARSDGCATGWSSTTGPTAPARVAVVAPTLLRMVIHEGRNRQIRRMCEAVGHPVVRLVRTRIGPLADPSLGPGAFRPLSFDEVRALAAAATPVEAGGSASATGATRRDGGVR